MFAHRRSGLLIGWPLLVLSSGLTSGGAASSNAITSGSRLKRMGRFAPAIYASAVASVRARTLSVSERPTPTSAARRAVPQSNRPEASPKLIA
jgi:hypothetical protein